MRLEFNPHINHNRAEDDRYLTPWPGYAASSGKRWRWPTLKTDLNAAEQSFPFVAVRLLCSSCDTPLAVVGRSLNVAADPRAILWASLGTAVVSFVDDQERNVEGDWHVHWMLVTCYRALGKKQRCPGELRRNAEKLVSRVDEMHARGRHAIFDLNE